LHLSGCLVGAGTNLGRLCTYLNFFLPDGMG
jgi:hypothetical protein